MKFTENMLDNYSQPLSTSEDQLCKNSIRLVGDALKRIGFTDDSEGIHLLYPDTYSYSLQLKAIGSDRKIKIFVQGSYANNTNVRTQSDVDIAVIQEEVFRTEYRPAGSAYPQSDDDYGFCTAPLQAKTFKDEVQECLEYTFGSDVERKNKSIKVHGNTYRKDVDTVPCLRYRDYRKDYNRDETNYVGGVVIFPDEGSLIINYPEQHITNGRIKNERTNHYYKKMVRIIKKMRYLMKDDPSYMTVAEGVSSFMLESLLWNIDNEWYLDNCSYYRRVFAFDQMIALLLRSKGSFTDYKEANGIKPLCENATALRKLCDFIDALSRFYEYE